MFTDNGSTLLAAGRKIFRINGLQVFSTPAGVVKC
jgi:hypothetical protein